MLEDCGIEDEGATALVEALKVNKALTNVNVLFNRNIGNKAKTALKTAVSTRDNFKLQC